MADQLLLIAGMALVTYLPRSLPLLFLAGKQFRPGFLRWLEMVPPAVLGALLAPDILLQQGADGPFLALSSRNVLLMAALPTVCVGWWTRSFFLTLATGMGCVAALRALGW